MDVRHPLCLLSFVRVSANKSTSHREIDQRPLLFTELVVDTAHQFTDLSSDVCQACLYTGGRQLTPPVSTRAKMERDNLPTEHRQQSV